MSAQPGAVSGWPMTDAQATAIAEWEARLHTNEVAYWAEHLDEFEKRLPRLRRNRLGDARAARMVRDVLKELQATHGRYLAQMARGRLMARLREGASGGGRPEP